MPTPSTDDISGECDLVVVGAGIIGLAVAREIKLRKPDLSLTVLEKEDRIGAHQTSHNSGVIHAGVYYTPGSLKAKLCVEGAAALYRYCEEKNVPFSRCGKLIIARSDAELPALGELERRAQANGVPAVRRLTASQIKDIEPHAHGVAALHSGSTGVVDFAGVASAYRSDVEATGAVVGLRCGVRAVSVRQGRVLLSHQRGEVWAKHAIFCGGLWSDRLAVAAGAPKDPRIVPFRGGYLRLRPQRTGLVRALIYPVPDPSLPFLGVHLTKTVSGDVLIGPTALLAPSRTAYRLRQWSGRDAVSTLAWPGTWRMARRWWRTGLKEARYAMFSRAFLREAMNYVPELAYGDVMPGPSGVRAQALAQDGSLVDDFVISTTERCLHVRNAPSPAATSSLAIAELIADRAEQMFERRSQRATLSAPALLPNSQA